MIGENIFSFFTIVTLFIHPTNSLNVTLISSDTALIKWQRTFNGNENVEIVFRIVGDRYE